MNKQNFQCKVLRHSVGNYMQVHTCIHVHQHVGKSLGLLLYARHKEVDKPGRFLAQYVFDCFLLGYLNAWLGDYLSAYIISLTCLYTEIE